MLGFDSETLDLMQLYRATDALMSNREAIQKHLFTLAMSWFALHPTVTLFDLANT